MKRVHDERHLAFIRRLPCLICKSENRSHAAHVRYGEMEYGKRQVGMQEKPDDRWTVPLCEEHHLTGDKAQHKSNEREWWERHGKDPLVIAALLYSHSCVGDEVAAHATAMMA